MSQVSSALSKVSMKDLKASDPRWCTGCGDYTILVGLRKFMVKHQIRPENTVNVSGIGCSGRIPHYMNTYGLHGIHGRAVPLALGIKLARPNLDVFIHSGDGDSMSIGGNHLLHGMAKNFNCVYLMFDNQIYGLTKQQTSPTTRRGLITQTMPKGSLMDPINPLAFALGAGASFVASTAEWMSGHFLEVLEKAYEHKGFSFVHVAQRCPKFNPAAWNYTNSDWVTFLSYPEKGISPDYKSAPDASEVEHDFSDLEAAYKLSKDVTTSFGIFYQVEKLCYDQELRTLLEDSPKKNRAELLEEFCI